MQQTTSLPAAWRTSLVLVVALALAVLAGPVVLVSLAASPQAPAPAYDWLQFGGDAQHSSNNTHETAISRANVASLRPAFRVPTPDIVGGAPVFLSAVPVAGGPKDVLFLTTQRGDLLALDAQTGAQLWTVQHGPGTCHINNGSAACYTTSSPAIDPGRQYVYAYGLDGKVHKHRVTDGTEVIGGGWPAVATLKGFDEKGSSHLAIATGGNGTSYLYVAHAGYPGDRGDYQGHITAINLSDGSQHVFNTLCSGQAVHFVSAPGSPDCGSVQSGVWARPGVVYDPNTDRIYLSTGNGEYGPAQGMWGDSVLTLHPDGSGGAGKPLDSYTPGNYQQLSAEDADLGSTAPAILPAVSGSKTPHLGVQGGKDGQLRLLNLDNLSGQGGPGHTGGEVGAPVPFGPGGAILTQPAVWTNPSDGRIWIVVSNGNGIAGFRLNAATGVTPSLSQVWSKSSGGTSPLIANGILYYAGGNQIRALDPATGTTLWTDNGLGGIHWQSPVVANGMLYIADQAGQLSAYGPTSLPKVFYLPVIIR